MGFGIRNKIIVVLAISFTGSGANAVSEQSDTIASYRQHIGDLQSKHGAYDARIGEQLLGLGLVYQLANDHDQAAITLKQALQIKRVNNGLYDMGQIPILKKLVKSNIANEHWTDVDRNYHQMLWVHKRNYDGTDLRLLTVLGKVGCWKLKAYQQNLLEDNLSDLPHEAERIYSSAITLLSSHSQTDPRLIDLLYGQALANYQIQSYNAGTVLKRVVSIYEANMELPRDGYADALVHLGDWNLLAGSQKRAHKNYKKAYVLMIEDADGREHLDKLFGSPKVIPALKMDLPELDEHRQYRANRKYIRASLDVSENGIPENIKILDGDLAENNGDKRKAKKEIQSRRYRPRYKGGEPIATVNHHLRLVRVDRE